jgi:hypothetical protein
MNINWPMRNIGYSNLPGVTPPSYPLYGRWHIDRAHSFLYHETGFAGIIELARLAKLPVQRAARASIGTILTSMQFDVAVQRRLLIPWRADGEDHLLLRVQDTGIGMPPEVDFANLNSRGATLVQSLASHIGGRIRVDRAGGDTHHQVSLPPGAQRDIMASPRSTVSLCRLYPSGLKVSLSRSSPLQGWGPEKGAACQDMTSSS